MRRLKRVLWAGLAAGGLTQCTSAECDCLPTPGTALVYGRVTDAAGTAVAGTTVHAFSRAAPGCVPSGRDFGTLRTRANGTFRMGLTHDFAQDGICVLVYARPPQGTAGLSASDTTLVVLAFRDAGLADSARVDLVLPPAPEDGP
jgi:hypothetical protein